jgi:hypothetical protein
MKLYEILPESASAPVAARKRYFNRTLWPGLVMVIASLGVVVAPDTQLIRGGALGAIALMAAYMSYEFLVLLRAMDELQRQIHITALAISGGAVSMMFSAIGVIEAYAETNLITSIFVFPIFLLGYYIGLLTISARYR